MATTDLADRVAALQIEVAQLRAELSTRNGGASAAASPVSLGESAIPAQISVEAAARVVELGMQREFEQLLAHARQTMPNLTAIEVTRYDDPDEPGQARVLMAFHLDLPAPSQKDQAWWDWTSWEVRAFPGHVLRWFNSEMRYRE